MAQCHPSVLERWKKESDRLEDAMLMTLERVKRPHARECWYLKKLEKARERILPEVSKRNTAWQYLDVSSAKRVLDV